MRPSRNWPTTVSISSCRWTSATACTRDQPRGVLPQLWAWNYDMPAPPTTPEALAAWTRYVEFMVKHFRDRVKHFEIWNEWNISCYWGDVPNLEHYLAVARAAIPVIRQHAPDAKIMMGSWAGFPHGIASWSPEQLAASEKGILYLQADASAGARSRLCQLASVLPDRSRSAERLRRRRAGAAQLASKCRLPRSLHGHGMEL